VPYVQDCHMHTIADLLTTAQVAERYNASVATVNKWAASGKLPVALTVPGGRLYDPDEVARFMSTQTRLIRVAGAA